jgi:hypothetical protein
MNLNNNNNNNNQPTTTNNNQQRVDTPFIPAEDRLCPYIPICRASLLGSFFGELLELPPCILLFRYRYLSPKVGVVQEECDARRRAQAPTEIDTLLGPCRFLFRELLQLALSLSLCSPSLSLSLAALLGCLLRCPQAAFSSLKRF